jgi:hypothetical protein
MFSALHIAPTKGCLGAESLEPRAFNGDTCVGERSTSTLQQLEYTSKSLPVKPLLLLVRLALEVVLQLPANLLQ